MRKTLLVIFFLQFLVFSSAQSILVNNAADSESNFGAEQLLTDVLLDGGLCSSTSNFQLMDNPAAPFPSADRSWGYFKKGNSDFPFERGIVLTSGFARNAQGPDTGIVSDGDYSWGGDSDATELAGITTNNVTIFEFDFIPQGNEISFNYIFASEEYPDWACSQYNDIFAFIISGPGIVNDPGLSGKNIALLPNGDPVTINNVNNQPCGDDTYYVHGPFTSNQYGGRTVPLTAYSEVTPGATYHIRLLVADASDTGYDSAVFLEAGSFSLGSTIVDETGVDIGDNLMVCGQDEYTLHVNVDDPSVELQWYKDGVIIPGATTNSLIITESGVYKIEVTSGDCAASDEVDVLFGDLDTNGTQFLLEEVDFNGDGLEIFDLTEFEDDVVDDPASHTFEYYTSQSDADNQVNPIATPTAYQAAHGTIVYARVTNDEGCFKIVTIHLELLDDCINPEAACPGDDFGLNIPFQNDGEIPTTAPPGPDYGCLFNQPYPRFFYFQVDQPGTLNFYMNQYTEPDMGGTGIDVDFIIWGPFEEVPCDYEDLTTPLIVDCSYSADYEEYASIPNAQSGEIYIMLITNYAGSYGQFGYVNLIFDEETSTGTFDCSIVTGDESYAACDDDQDGQVQFDLAGIANDISNGNAAQVTFYETEEDATNDTGLNIIPTAPYTVTNATSPDTIYGQIKNTIGEVEEVITITLTIFDGVTGAQDAEFFTCDLGDDNVEIIDLTAIDVIANPENYTIRYYEDEQDAVDGNAAFIPNPASYETATTTVYVRIENENGCFDVVEINIEVGDLSVDLGEGFSMCEGEFEITASGDFSGFTNVTYTWTRNNTIIEGETSQTLIVTQPGTYGVTVTTDEGCSGSDTVTVTQGESPVITAVNVGPDYVIVEATGGVTPYQYSLTGYVWQDSNQFNYLQPGIHTVYVRSAEGCITSQEFAVFFIPTMFTPNGDGINDTWNIPGLEIYPGSNVTIYDRTGRMVYQSELSSHVIWNGFFMNGQKAPTQDYWYVINVSDGRQFTGHITVKSRGEKQ